MKKLLPLLLAASLLTFSANTTDALSLPVAAKTTGQNSPHILKADTYSLNARNVKTLKSHGPHLWVGTAKGLIRYNTRTPDDYTLFDNKNGLLSNGIFSIAFDSAETPWVGTYAGGLSRLAKGNRWININTPHGLADAFVFDIEFTANAVWIATWSGANLVQGDPLERKAWKTFTVENTKGGLIDDWVYAIEIGRDGRVWFGTESGLSMFDGKTWKSWNHNAGLGAPYALVEKDNQGMVSALQGSHHTDMPAFDGPSTGSGNPRPNYVVCMLLDRNANLWIGTWGGGLALFDTKTHTFRNFTVRDGLPGNYILALKEDPFGNLWIGSNNGLSRFDGTSFLNYSKINGLISDFIFSIEFTKDHSMYVGGHFGMNRLSLDPTTRKLVKLD